jgi:sialidase-1
MKSILLPIVCLFASLSLPANGEAKAEFVPVFVGGQDGYACFRIPALLTTKKGTLLAIADGRISRCSDIPNPLDLVLKRSTDQGRTWGALQVIADYGKNTNDTDIYPAYGITNPVSRVAAGDAALLLDRTNGRIWVLYDNGGSVKGKPRNRALKLELRFSDDDGATWCRGMDVEADNPGLRPEGIDFMASPGNGIQLSGGPYAGRLIFATYVHGEPWYSTFIYSDDHGKTWRRGGNAGTGGGEIQIAETEPGHLIATLRNNTFGGTGVRFFNTSADAGKTWDQPWSEFPDGSSIPDPKCQGSLFGVEVAGTNKPNQLFLSNAAHPFSRTNATLRISYDLGRTWPVSNLVYSGASAYSSLTILPSGKVGMLLEMDGYKRICFASPD